MKRALLVVDMQKGFQDPQFNRVVPSYGKTLSKVKELIDFCRGKKIPIFYFQYVAKIRKEGELGYERDQDKNQKMGESRFVSGSQAIEISEEINNHYNLPVL